MAQWTYVDLFSGCGGMSAGLSAAGMRPIFAADNDKWANKTYEANLNHEADTLDLTSLRDPDAMAAWVQRVRGESRGSRLLLAGGPPCQGFSSHVKTAGDRRGRNELVGLFADIAVALAPDVVLMENVADLAAERSWSEFSGFRSTLVAAGYRVRAKVINFASLGVPQERFRTIVIARRDGRPVHYPAAARKGPAEYATVKEAIGDLPPVEPGEAGGTDPMHVPSRHRPSTIEILRQVPRDGGSRPPGVGPACLDRTRGKHGGYTDVYGRLSWSDPAPTITARCRTPSCGRFAHPEQDRGLTVREAALLQTFPADWNFIGPFDDRYKQIGNAVPPLVAEHLGRHVMAGMPKPAVECGVLEIGDSPVGSSFSVLIPGLRKRERGR